MIAIGLFFTASHDRLIGGHIAVAHRPHECKALLKATGIVVVKEQPADSAGFVAVFEKKVVIAPLFEPWINLLAKRCAGLPGGLVPMAAIVFIAVIRRQVIAPAEPPHRGCGLFLRDKKTYVGVAGRDIRITRVDHQRHPHGFERPSGQLRPMGCGGSRHLLTVDVGEITTALFNHCPCSQYAGPYAGALRSDPGILNKFPATVLLLEGCTDAILQIQQVSLYGCLVGGNFAHRSSLWSS